MSSMMAPESFLKTFFAPPNLAWPNPELASPAPDTIQPFLKALSDRGECPVVLPRRSNQTQPSVFYVVCWNVAHAGRIRPLLEAAVAHHWCRFDGRVTRLDPADAVDSAVLDLVGPGTTFFLRPTEQTERNTSTALNRLAATIGDAPLRVPAAPRPIGRMLREFDLALASGAIESSASLLREIKIFGGISHENIAFLEMRRLIQLGKEHELLAHGSLPTLVRVDPPRVVREGVLAAWAKANLARPLPAADVDGALAAIESAEPDVAMLVDESVARVEDPDVSTVCALVAIGRREARLTDVAVENQTVDPTVRERLRPHAQESGPRIRPDRDEQIFVAVADPDVPAMANTSIDSWLAWVERLQAEEGLSFDGSQSLTWEAAWKVDAELASAVDALPEVATDDLLSGVAAFLEADDMDRPAAQTAASLVRRYLLAERFSPVDLGAICALLEIFLRSAPPSALYRQLLDDVRDFAGTWVAVGNATRAIDLADAVVCGPIGDAATRTEFVTALLAPLYQQKHRLPNSLRQLAGLVTDDINLGYNWSVAEPADSKQSDERGQANSRILLYSLDTGALARVKTAIDLQWPDVQVETSSDLVGSPALRHHARNADLIVLATRRATHAAAGFIADNSKGALIRYSNGSGSASMLRSVDTGFAELTS